MNTKIFSTWCVTQVIAVTVLFPALSWAVDLRIAWTAPTTNSDNTPLTDLSGYKLYRGSSTGNYSNISSVGNVLTYTITGLSQGTRHCMVVTALDTSGNESAPSNELCVDLPSNDTDGDGVSNIDDCSPLDATKWRDRAYLDPDNDGVRNDPTLVTMGCQGATLPSGVTLNDKGLDNCPSVSNADQLDQDRDGLGDACDSSPLPPPGGDPDPAPGPSPRPSDAPIPAERATPNDFDGDGVTDLGFTSTRAEGTLHFTIELSDGSDNLELDLGSEEDTPAPADYNGDGLVDLASVSSGKSGFVWQIRDSATEEVRSETFGKEADGILAGCYFKNISASTKAVVHRGKGVEFQVPGEEKTHLIRLRQFIQVRQLSCADLNGDGTDELLVTGTLRQQNERRQVKGQYLVALNTRGRIVFRAKVRKPAGIIFGDIEGDGDIEPGYFSTNREGTKIMLLQDQQSEPVVHELPAVQKLTPSLFTLDEESLISGAFGQTTENELLSIIFENGSTSILRELDEGTELLSAINVSGKRK